MRLQAQRIPIIHALTRNEAVSDTAISAIFDPEGIFDVAGYCQINLTSLHDEQDGLMPYARSRRADTPLHVFRGKFDARAILRQHDSQQSKVALHGVACYETTSFWINQEPGVWVYLARATQPQRNSPGGH